MLIGMIIFMLVTYNDYFDVVNLLCSDSCDVINVLFGYYLVLLTCLYVSIARVTMNVRCNMYATQRSIYTTIFLVKMVLLVVNCRGSESVNICSYQLGHTCSICLKWFAWRMPAEFVYFSSSAGRRRIMRAVGTYLEGPVNLYISQDFPTGRF